MVANSLKVRRDDKEGDGRAVRGEEEIMKEERRGEEREESEDRLVVQQLYTSTGSEV